MINRISDNYTNPYVKNKNKVSETQDAPAFLLNYDEKGVVWDRDKEEEKEKNVKEEEQKNNPPKQQKDVYESTILKAEKTQHEDEKPSFLDGFKKMIDMALDGAKKAFKSLFEFIWYGDEKDKIEVSDNVEVQENISVIETENEETEVTAAEKAKEKYINAIDREYYEKLDKARKGVSGVPARNSTLLTTYNKRGKINQIDAAESDRVLRGDKSIKL